MQRTWRLRSFLLALSAAWACESDPVRWSEPVAATVTAGQAELVVDSAGRTSWRDGPAWHGRSPLPDACATSVRVHAGAHALYGVWWAVRADSSAVLRAGHSLDAGVSWRRILVVDSADASPVGCRRPSPSIAVVGDDVYVAYAMKAPDGTGVFFAHSLDGGTMFHAPVAVVYGGRLVATAIASDGHRVALAYEEPNGTMPRVDVALSRTQGHIFDARVRASPEDRDIVFPAVAISGSMIAVGWTLRSGGEHGPMSMVRVGRMSN
jgi:hypothetical protein